LKAEEQKGISYSWRSIVRGLEAIKEGIIWRVGNGDDINMWVDPWIPRGTTRRPITPRRNNILTRVSELIDPQTGNWDGELVRDIFWEDDVVTPDFRRGTKCISYVRQDQFTHI
jgi:hypothetical protein